MSGIFISYRRSGASGMAYRIADELKRSFGEKSIFLDVESIDPGVPFAEAIQNSLNRCSIALIVMGPEWLTMTDKQGQRRLDRPDDWVRQEVRLALESNIRVIPVLVQGAIMPSAEQLPSDIQRFSSLHAFSFIDSQTHWAFDIQRLQDQISDIDKRLGKKRKNSNHGRVNTDGYSIKAISGLVLAFIFIAYGIVGYADEDEALGSILFIVGAILLCFFGFKDIRAGLKKGMGFAIGGGVLSMLAMLMSFGQLAYLYDVEPQGTLSVAPAVNSTPKPVVDQPKNNTLAALEMQAVTPSVINISGKWLSEDGLTYTIRQNEKRFKFIEYNIFGAQVGSGDGQLEGNRLDYKYYNSLIDVSGKGTGKVDGDIMYLRFTDQYNNAISYELYRE